MRKVLKKQHKIGLNIYRNKNMIYERLKQFDNVISDVICTNEKKEIIEINDAIRSFKKLLLDSRNDGIIYCIGNGGSAGIASHFSNDLIKALKIPSSTLVDSNVLTCLSNDFGYENCYSEALKVNMKKEDLLIAISSSGNSKNIINAVNVAKAKKAKVITLSGFKSDNILRQIGNINFYLNVEDYGLVEVGHLFILHTIVDLFNKIETFKPFFSVQNA